MDENYFFTLNLTLDEFDEDVVNYKHKKKKPRTPKSKHKHNYTNCVFEHTYMKSWGLSPKLSIGTYCPICGKIGIWEDASWKIKKNPSIKNKPTQVLALTFGKHWEKRCRF